MPTMDSLIALIGLPVDAPSVQLLIASERLQSSTEEDLEEGEPIRSFLSSKPGGYVFAHTLGRITTLFIYVRPKHGYDAFRDATLHGLTSKSTCADVRRALGMPTRTGAAHSHPVLGRFGPWDRFDRQTVCLHFQYTEPDNGIELVTVVTPDVAP
jgi:hypothetical protein